MNFDEKRLELAFSWNKVSDDSKWRRCTWFSKGHFIQKTQWNNHFKKVMILQFSLFIYICSTKCFKVNTCQNNWKVMFFRNITRCTRYKRKLCLQIMGITCLLTVELVFASLVTQSSISLIHFEVHRIEIRLKILESHVISFSGLAGTKVFEGGRKGLKVLIELVDEDHFSIVGRCFTSPFALSILPVHLTLGLIYGPYNMANTVQLKDITKLTLRNLGGAISTQLSLHSIVTQMYASY